MVLTFGRCGAYAADQDADSTAVGWAESYASADAARQAALSECRWRDGGSGCVVRAWGCNGPVIEEGLNLDQAARRQIQQGLAAGGFNPGPADGLFDPRTRAAIRRWQSSGGTRATGHLDGVSADALRSAGAAGPAVAAVPPSAPATADAAQQSAAASEPTAPPAARAELEALFWQSIMNSTNPAEFEAYLAQFPNGVFRALAQARLAALRAPANKPRPTGVGPVVVGASGAPVSTRSARPRPGEMFRDCEVCPGDGSDAERRGGARALLEVTVGEFRTGRRRGAMQALGGFGAPTPDREPARVRIQATQTKEVAPDAILILHSERDVTAYEHQDGLGPP